MQQHEREQQQLPVARDCAAELENRAFDEADSDAEMLAENVPQPE